MIKRVFIFLVFSFTILHAQNEVDPILVDVDMKPTWPGCENETDADTRKTCLDEKLAKFFDDFIIYPERARKRKLEGQVVVQFVVEKDGSVSNIQIVHDIGEGCGNEVVIALERLPRLIPATHGGQPARVLYTVPVNFVLK